MSPKTNRSGTSYDENDPRSLQAPGDAGPRVTRARDMDAAQEGLPSADDLARARENATADDEAEERDLETEQVEGDNYDDKDAWPYASLQEESRRRWSDLAVNGVSRDELVARLREDDAKRAEAGDGAAPAND